MPDVSRRGFIRAGLFGLGGIYVTSVLTGCGGDDDGNKLGMGRFAHGVASGDPLSDSVVLWTRVTPADTSAESVRVSWEISDAELNVIAKGAGDAHISRDFTIKVDVRGLRRIPIITTSSRQLITLRCLALPVPCRTTPATG